MQLCTLRSGGKKLLSDTLVLLIISNLYFCVNVFFLFVYHDFRVRSLCKYPCPVSGMTLSVHFFTSFFLFTGTVRPYTSSSSICRSLDWICSPLVCFCLVFAACLFSDIHIHLLSSTHSHEKEVPGTLFHCGPDGPQPQHSVLNACPRAGTPD